MSAKLLRSRILVTLCSQEGLVAIFFQKGGSNHLLRAIFNRSLPSWICPCRALVEGSLPPPPPPPPPGYAPAFIAELRRRGEGGIPTPLDMPLQSLGRGGWGGGGEIPAPWISPCIYSRSWGEGEGSLLSWISPCIYSRA